MKARAIGYAVGMVSVPDRIRAALDEGAVARLMDSMSRLGLQTPITVRLTEEDGVVLVAGRHRLAAAERLGWSIIQCNEVVATDDEARMWEIAENLHRAELTALERSEHVAEWARLSDASQVETHRPRKSGQQPGGINAAARELGVDKMEVHRSVKVDSLSSEAKQAARDAGLDDNRTVLLAAAREPSPEAQLVHLRMEAEKREALKVNRGTDRVIELTEAQQFATWLMARTDLHEMQTVIAWLEGTKPKDVIDAMRREAA